MSLEAVSRSAVDRRSLISTSFFLSSPSFLICCANAASAAFASATFAFEALNFCNKRSNSLSTCLYPRLTSLSTGSLGYALGMTGRFSPQPRCVRAHSFSVSGRMPKRRSRDGMSAEKPVPSNHSNISAKSSLCWRTAAMGMGW